MIANTREFATIAISIGLLALAPAASHAQDNPAPPAVKPIGSIDRTKGFLGQEFGSSASTFKGLKLYEDRGPLKLYTIDGDLDRLGPVKLAEVVYYFYDDKFYGVALHTTDGQDSTDLLRIMQTAYGYGTQGDPDEPTYYWPGKTASARFELNRSTGDADVFISDNKLDHDYNDYEAKACTEAAAKL